MSSLPNGNQPNATAEPCIAAPPCLTFTKPRVIASRKTETLTVRLAGEIDQARQAAQDDHQNGDEDGALRAEGHSTSQAVEEAVRRPDEVAVPAGPPGGPRGVRAPVRAISLGCNKSRRRKRVAGDHCVAIPTKKIMNRAARQQPVRQ